MRTIFESSAACILPVERSSGCTSRCSSPSGQARHPPHPQQGRGENASGYTEEDIDIILKSMAYQKVGFLDYILPRFTLHAFADSAP